MPMWWSLLACAVRPDVAKTIPVTQLCESNDAKLLDARQRANSQLARYRMRRFGVEIVDTRTASAYTPDILVASELLRILRSKNVYPDCLAVNWSRSRPIAPQSLQISHDCNGALRFIHSVE
jgi:hypothetical protein